MLLLPWAGYAALARRLEPIPFLMLALYGAVPIALVAGTGRTGSPFDSLTRTGLAIAALWLPVELGLLHGPMLPLGALGALNGTPLLALDVGLLIFVVTAPVLDLGFTFAFSRRDFGSAAAALLLFAVFAIPLGLGIGFIHFHPRPFQPLPWLVRAISVYFLIAIPEELLFRGLLQNLLEKRWPGGGRRLGSLAVAAAVFGAAHLDNPPIPNVRYAVLATLAGLAYGWCWQRTRKVTASALTHGAVDVVWHLIF